MNGLVKMALVFFSLLLISMTSGCSEEEPEKSELPIEGVWVGELDLGETSISLEFSFTYSEEKLTAALSVPQQNLSDLPASEVSIDAQGGLTLRFTQIGGIYTAAFSEGAFTGTWKQSGSSFPLSLKPKSVSETESGRVQDPIPPFPYRSEEVTFPGGGAGYSLAGTLTVPAGNGPFPAVVLVSGSGQQNHDSELFNHRPFLVLADALTRAGIAVLRYDDQGIGGSGGNPANATTYNFADDAAAALRFLTSQEAVDRDRMGILGHSEGGLIASILSAAAEEHHLSWAVLLASPGLPGNELLILQNRAIGKASGLSSQQLEVAEKTNRTVYDIAVSDLPEEERASQIEKTLIRAGVPKKSAEEGALALLTPWMETFLETDPAEYLSRISIPVLALNGTLDLQVPYEENLPVIEETLKIGESDGTVEAVEGLNHLFQPAVTGLPAEYGSIETTFSPEAIDLMSSWILSQQ